MSMDAVSGVALWRQVADGIERGIADGSFAPGERLPGETEIAETYRVNRHTVRRALATLAERGLVRAERGSGTYVEAQRLAYPLRSRTRFSEIVGAGGQEPRGQMIDAAEDVATRELARELRLKTGAPLTTTVKLLPSASCRFTTSSVRSPTRVCRTPRTTPPTASDVSSL